MLIDFAEYLCLAVAVLFIVHILYLVFIPRGYFRGIHFGKLDFDAWSGEDYMDWYFESMKRAKLEKNMTLLFRATMGWNTAYYEKYLWRRRNRRRAI